MKKNFFKYNISFYLFFLITFLIVSVYIGIFPFYAIPSLNSSVYTGYIEDFIRYNQPLLQFQRYSTNFPYGTGINECFCCFLLIRLFAALGISSINSLSLAFFIFSCWDIYVCFMSYYMHPKTNGLH